MKNSIKRAQSRAGSSFAERENQRSLAGGESNFRPKVKQLRRKLMMTLALLLTVATGAWADEQKVVLKVDPITVAKGTEAEIEVKMDYTAEKTLVGLSFSLYLPDGILLKGFDTKEAQDAARASALMKAFDLDVTTGLWGNEEGAAGWLAVKQKTDGGFQITLIDQDEKTPFVTTHAPVISVWVHAVADVANVNGTINGITLTDNENKSVEQGNIADVLIPFNATAQEPESTVALTRGTGDKINEWTLTNGMPAGNVTVTAEYFPQATAAEGALTAATGVAATTSAPLVTLDASKLTGATKLMYFVNKSTDPAPGYDAQGWSDKLPTADSFTEAGGYNVYYYPLGTDDEDPAKTYSDGDICAAPILVSLDAAPTYNVEFAEGTDPNEWSADPAADVKKGQTVTVTYTGSKKVIGVKAEKMAPALIVNPAVGQVIGDDGKNYADAAAATSAGATAVAKIVYVGRDNGEAAPYNHGLALALSDASCKWKTSQTDAGHTKQTSSTFTEESGLQYNDATHNSDTYPAFKAAIANKGTAAPTGCSAWFLASGYQWKKIIGAAGLSNLGLQSGDYYWSSTEYNAGLAWGFDSNGGTWIYGYKDNDIKVRACLAF